jgi:hypothetical protein
MSREPMENRLNKATPLTSPKFTQILQTTEFAEIVLPQPALRATNRDPLPSQPNQISQSSCYPATIAFDRGQIKKEYSANLFGSDV